MKQTAVEWLSSQLGEYIIWEEKIIDLVEQAKEMEADREYEIKAFWFGRGINAGRENKIEELKPKKD
jgi:hypothetical protein